MAIRITLRVRGVVKAINIMNRIDKKKKRTEKEMKKILKDLLRLEVSIARNVRKPGGGQQSGP